MSEKKRYKNIEKIACHYINEYGYVFIFLKAIEKTNKLSLALADYASGLSRQERLNRSEMIKRIAEIEILLEEIKIMSGISEMVDKSKDEQIKKIKQDIKKENAENKISED